MISLCTSAPCPQRVSGRRYTGWRVFGSGDLLVGCSTATQNRRQIPRKGCYVSWGFPGFALHPSGIPVPPRSDQQTFCARPKTPRRDNERPLGRLLLTCQLGRQRGRVVSASDLQSDGPGFKSRSGHLLDLFSVVPSSNPRPCL